MRARNIKPGFFANEVLGSLEPIVRLLFAGLWCLADKEGRLEDRPLRIKHELLGYDACTGEMVSDMLDDLDRLGFIKRYSVQGARFIQILAFARHQSPHPREPASVIPPIPPASDSRENSGNSAESRGSSGNSMENPSDTLIPDTLIPDTLIPDTQAAATSAAVQLDRFDCFWAEYPRKRSKTAAMRAWQQLNPDGTLFERIMAAVREQKKSADWTKDAGRYAPYPATWLNKGCWDDVMDEPVADASSFDTDAFYDAAVRASMGEDPTGSDTVRRRGRTDDADYEGGYG